jgi:DNA helicase-2/ATP-dependent DNA helicase PcrA
LTQITSKELILENLNSEQIKAVVHKGGPLLIIAGAGTGKTTVITRRIAWLISEKLAKPSEILALTFTDKAANEMEARVDVLVPYGYVDVAISTFHAFGDRALRDHAIELGLRPDYRVLSYAEQLVFLRQNLDKLPLKEFRSLSDPTRHLEALLSVISRAQDENIFPGHYLVWARKRKDKKQIEISRVYAKYQELKLKENFVDFGDQVTLTIKLFRENPKIIKEYTEKYKYILVDEFQDTNYAQFELLKLLAGKNQNITVVGDDDQSIYKFRGAAISNILNFTKVFKKTKKVVLNRNYRSTQLILDAAARLIKHNNPDRLEVKEKIDKGLKGTKGGGEKKAEHRYFDRVTSEADWVAKKIREEYEKGRRYQDFAILVRANADAEPFRQSLNLSGIPYVFPGGGGLFVFPEVKFAVSFLRVIGDLSDSVSLYDLSVSEVYRLDPLDLQKMNTYTKRRNQTLHHVFAHLEEAEILSDVKSESRVTVKKIMEDIDYYLKFAKNRTTGEVLYQFLKRSGYLGKLTREETVENDSRLKNLAAFFDKVREFKDLVECDRVAEFVKYLNILREAGENPESAQPDIDVDAVNLITVHKAKGLEFPVVFLVSLVAEKFPARGRRDPLELPEELVKEDIPAGDFHLKEERRLFYVGMTRAKDELYLTSSLDYGGKRERKISQFVLEALDIPRADVSTIKRTPIDQIELFAPSEGAFLPMRKIGEEEVLSLSYYPIDDYLTCPLKYKYVHILNVPLLPSHTIMYGSAIHKAVQSYFSAKLNQKKCLEKDLLSVFKNNWSSEGFISRSHEEARFKNGLAALKRFYKEQEKKKEKVRSVEEEFKFVKDKIQIKGRFDLVLGTPRLLSGQARSQELGDKVKIVDFKTTEVKTQEEADKRTRENIQLAIYAMAWQEMRKKLPDRVQLYFVDSGLIGSDKKTPADLDKTWKKIKGVAEGIRAADFHPTPAAFKCSYCPYNEICPSSAV